MQHYKISKLLNNSTVSTFVTENGIEINDLSSSQYSDLCHYRDAYTVVKGRITVERDKQETKR